MYMAKKDLATLFVKKSTHADLKSIGHKGETFDDIIQNLLTEHREHIGGGQQQ